jgi:hypothetical protein
MPDYGTGSFFIANIADATLVPGIAWVSGDGGTRCGDQSPAPFLASGDPGVEEQVYSKTLTFTLSTTTPGLDGIPAWLLNQSSSEPGHRLFVGNLSYHHSDPLEPDGQVNYSSGDTLTHQYVVTSIAHAATGNDNLDVLIFVDDVVGGDASRQLGRFTLSVPDMELNEVDVAHADLLFSENAPGGAGCSVYICGENSPQVRPEPVTYTGGHFELVLEGHSEANLVFDSTGGGRSTVLLPYIEQHGGEADDGGFVIDRTTGDGPKGGDTVGVIAIITPTEHGGSVLEFSVENFPNNSPSSAPFEGFGFDRGHMGSSFDLVFPAQTTLPQRDGNAVATESLEIAHEGFLEESDSPALGCNLGDTAIEAAKLPMHLETTISSAPSPDQAVTWTAIAMADSGAGMGSYSDYSLYDLVV